MERRGYYIVHTATPEVTIGMNKEWSEQNKTMQAQIGKEATWPDGLRTLADLRGRLMETLLALQEELAREDFDAMPFPGADGYHSKTIAYSVWHIFRIEDIVAHTLVAGDEQVFFAGGYQRRTRSPIITTGNELAGEEIAAFSRQLDLDGLYAYAAEVRGSTEAILKGLPYPMLKTKPPEERRERLLALETVSRDEKAAWLVDCWCGKDIRGLIRMPFSRHWIMHVEACLRIRNGIRG